MVRVSVSVRDWAGEEQAVREEPAVQHIEGVTGDHVL